MKKFSLKSLLFASTAAMLLPVTATANANNTHNDNWPHWYVGLGVGYSFVDDVDVDVEGGGSYSADVDGGYNLSASLGYTPNFGDHALNNFRFEGEFFYSDNDLDTAANSGQITENIENFAFMLNAYYDLPIATRTDIYFGGGVGIARTRIDDDKDTGFAYQLKTGLSWAPERMPYTEWGIGYRFFGREDADMPGYDLDYYMSHNVELTSRFKF